MPQAMSHRQLVRRVARWDRMDSRAIEEMRKIKSSSDYLTQESTEILNKADALVDYSEKVVTKAQRDLRNLKKALRQ